MLLNIVTNQLFILVKTCVAVYESSSTATTLAQQPYAVAKGITLLLSHIVSDNYFTFVWKKPRECM